MSAQPIELIGIRLVGLSAENGRKLLLSIAVVTVVLLARKFVGQVAGVLLRGDRFVRTQFWLRQALSLLAAVVIIIAMLSLWFDDPMRLTTALGLVTAGLAFALQRVVTALAGYFVIMRGKTFSVGDRIVMGGVRGDVIALGFTQTTIMEMGQPPPVQKDEPAMWVHSREYTGRLVTVSNARVFEEPVFNYTREFPFIWDELVIPISYKADRERVERMLRRVAQRHTADLQRMTEDERAELARRYLVRSTDVEPRVYLRMTDNWLELTLRFVTSTHGIRELKDAMTRDILLGLEGLHVEVATATFGIVAVPPLRFATDLTVGEPAPRHRQEAT